MTTSASHTSIHSGEASQSPPVPSAPWMPLGPITELWAVFSREATSGEALLAASAAFAALAEEREAIHLLNWLAPASPPSSLSRGAATLPASFSLLVAHETIIQALSRAATHWYEAARALVDSADHPPMSEGEEQKESPALDLETLIGYTLSQRVRVWAIAHSLLAGHLRQLLPQHEQGGEEAP